MRAALRSASGISIVEVLVATSLLVTTVAGVAQLLVVAVRQTLSVRISDAAAAAAQTQLERLRSLTFSYDAVGTPIASPELAPSPPGSLEADVSGYAQRLNESGVVVDADPDADGVVFVRRWSIAAPASGSSDALAIEVCVYRHEAATAGPPDACVSTIRARQP